MSIESCFAAVKLLSEVGRVEEALANYERPWTKTLSQANESTDVDEVRMLLDSARAVEKTFRAFLTKATDAVARLQERFTEVVNQSRFTSFPDEILLAIFEFAVDPDGIPNPTIVLSSVCRRFRDIISRATTIIEFPLQPLYYATAVASRSEAPNLFFVITNLWDLPTKSFAKRLRRFVELGTANSTRLTTIQLNLSIFEGEPYPHVEEIFRRFSEVALPNVRELELECTVVGGRKFEASAREWDMPSLEKLTICNILPQLLPRVASAIRSCRIGFFSDMWQNHDPGQRWTATELVVFLGKLKALEHVDTFLPLHKDDEQADAIAMDSIRSVVVRLPETRFTKCLNVIHLVKMRNLLSLDLRVGIRDITRLHQVLSNISNGFGTSTPTSLSNLSISIRHDELRPLGGPFSTIAKWCSDFKQLRNITLDSPRGSSHGLFSFSNEIESFRLSDAKSLITGNRIRLLRYVPLCWKKGPGQRAVWDTKEFEKERKYTSDFEFHSDSDDSDSDDADLDACWDTVTPKPETYMNFTRFEVKEPESDEEDW